MKTRRLRCLGVGLVGGAGLLGMTATMNAVLAAADGTALIMGYSGDPSPDQAYVAEVEKLFLDPAHPFPGQPTFPGYAPMVQHTPESDFPFTPFNSFDTASYAQSVNAGATELNQGIMGQLADGNPVVVFGYSESASVATQEMINLDNLPAGQQPDPADLSFVLLEDGSNPDGGIFERFPYLYSPSLPATPADSPYPTDIYTIQYSGEADFPQYPFNFVADLNALAGFTNLHLFLTNMPSTFDPAQIAHAVELPTSPGYTGDTEYFLIPTQNLPLLDMMRAMPGGTAMADLIQPDLRVMVDMGYSHGYANVPTPATLFPDVNFGTVFKDLALGFQQGMVAAKVDMGMLPASDLPDTYPYVPSADPGLTMPTTAATNALQAFYPDNELASLASDWAKLTSGLDGLGAVGHDMADPGSAASVFDILG